MKNFNPKHLPALGTGLDELHTARDAFAALEDLVSPVVTDDRVDLHLVNRAQFASLLAVLNWWLDLNLQRAQEEFVQLRKEASA